MNIAVYIGPYIDILPIKLFKEIKKFILIECQPNYTFFGSKIEMDKNKYKIHQTEYFTKLLKEYNKYGFEKVAEGENYLYFINKDDQIIEYYHSIYFNKEIPQYLQDKIKKCDTLIDLGFHPDKFILQLLQSKFNLITGTSTSYIQTNDKNILFGTKEINEEMEKRIEYIYIMKLPTEIYEYNHLNEVEIIQTKDFNKFLRITEDLKGI